MNANFNLSGATMLSKSEMKNVQGGKSYCHRLQEWAGLYYKDASKEYQDQWEEYWLEYCTK